MTKNTFKMEEERDAVDMGQLFVPQDLKARSFSTSTPFVKSLFNRDDKHALSETTIPNDSGLGSSITDSCVTSFADCSRLNTTARTLPRLTFKAPEDSIIIPDFPQSPISRWSFISRRSLDSMCGEERDGTSDFEHVKSLPMKCVRKLNLDLDLDASSDSEDESSTGTQSYTAPSIFDELRTAKKICNNESLLVEQFNNILSNFSPQVGDRLIGRKMGQKHVDILSELDQRDIIGLSQILSYLEPEDLCRMCNVSRQWEEICEKDTAAKQRRNRHVREKRRTLENIGKENCGVNKSRGRSRLKGQVLQSVDNQGLTPTLQPDPPEKKLRTTTDLFQEAASCLMNDESLEKCPKCCKPAKVFPVQDMGVCQSPDCSHKYCSKCKNSYHGTKDCVSIFTKRTKAEAKGSKICSKISKNRLKRL